MEKQNTPAWFYGPNGAAKIFDNLDDVPAGWQDHPSKISTTAPVIEKAQTPVSDPNEVDAHGHRWSADLHAASKSKTNAGLWRMKVGARRPDPLPGFPKDETATGAPPLDL